jgi:hypothetical protein
MTTAPAPKAPLLAPQEMERLSTLFHQLAHNKDTRGPLARMVKHIGSPVAGAFTDVELEDKFAALRKEFHDERMKAQIDAAAAAQARQKAELKKANRTDDEIADIEKVMAKFGLSDYTAGAKLYDADNPRMTTDKDKPDPWSNTGVWEFPTLPDRDGKMMDFKSFSKDPMAATRAAAYRTIDEFTRTRLSPAFHSA